MEIVFVSPEMVPYSKVGGLGDVVGALPKALKALGHKVTVLSPLYGSIDPTANVLARRLSRLKVPLGAETVQVELYEARLPSGVNVCLLAGPGLTDRQGVYGENGVAYADNHLRFALFARAAVEWIRAQPRTPDVVHAHDWPTALVPLFLKRAAEEDPKLATVRSVLTIHNVAHQGLFPKESLGAIGLPEQYGSIQELEFFGAVSWLKGGILHADRVTTVSPGYAHEILTAEGGARMDGVLRARTHPLVGILNGVDPAVWNPTTDPHLAARFDAEDATAKARCKSDLQERLKLPIRPEVPVFGMVSRLDGQKGIDLLLKSAATLLRQDVQVVVQGSGDAGLMQALGELSARMPDKFVWRGEYDDSLAHKIYGGSDFFMVPSRFEPCGLTQMYAMRYGTVPVVRATGGLRDTVVDCEPELKTGTGFMFGEDDPEAFYGALARAMTAYGHRSAFAKLIRRVMRTDWSWDRSARRYQQVYHTMFASEESLSA